jgi:hypothetical protein
MLRRAPRSSWTTAPAAVSSTAGRLRCTRCIVLHHGLDELANAVGTGGALTIVG